MNIEITLINKSDDMNNSEIVFFSKKKAPDFEEAVVAWRVVRNLGRNWTHKIKYSLQNQVGAGDSYGNLSDIREAANGQRWNVVRSNSGDVLELSTTAATSQHTIEIGNGLVDDAIDALIYNSGKVFACRYGVSPGEKAVFEFSPTLWVGVVSQVEEGAIMNSVILNDINTELKLTGITKANLIMTGGGTGPKAVPFNFELVPTEAFGM